MNRTLSLEDYVSLANSKLNEKIPALLRTATPQDAESIQKLNLLIPGLEYPLEGIQAILQEPKNLNYVIQENQKPNPKSREPGGYSPLLSFSLAYPSQQFPKIFKYMHWDSSEIPIEHNDPKALCLELKITHPSLQGQGIYKVIRTIQELAAYHTGYNKIYLQSFNENARDIHAQEGYQLLREITLTENEHGHNEYFMRLDLTAQRNQKNIDYLETARAQPKPTISSQLYI